MLNLEARPQFWFIVGSQDLYGDETLQKVYTQSKKIVNELNESDELEYDIVLKEIVTNQEEIEKIFKEVNYHDHVLGAVTWMHTFSPAKMWIRGTQILQKPLLHLATQYNKEIPWDTIDMDYMNLNQSAHGDREYAFINARLKKNNKVVFGHYQDLNVQEKINSWMRSVVGYHASKQVKVARFGDNMRNVAVTEGDKIEAQIQFGWTVDYYGIGDLVHYISKVKDSEVDSLLEEYKRSYKFDKGNLSEEKYLESIKYQAKIEIALERFLQEGNYNAFTTNFEDLHGMQQLPGLAVQRLNEKGIGFAGEGDWKTAALSRVFKVMTNNNSTGFMEDYVYNFSGSNSYVLQAHMLEVDPTWAANTPTIVVKPLDIGGKEDPARLVFDGKQGLGYAVTMIDMGNEFQLIINEIEAIELEQESPQLPVAKVVWRPKPSLEEAVQKWLELGAGHHTVATLGLKLEEIVDWANLMDLKHHIIR